MQRYGRIWELQKTLSPQRKLLWHRQYQKQMRLFQEVQDKAQDMGHKGVRLRALGSYISVLPWEAILSFLQDAFLHPWSSPKSGQLKVCLKSPLAFGIGVATLKKAMLDLPQS